MLKYESLTLLILLNSYILKSSVNFLIRTLKTVLSFIKNNITNL
jgi:hypothetical protein